ncbi:MAG TPA: hypothetical protein VJR05_15845 [Acidimicrobiia bacterium]|nr:hypothetical protein [Acidimicrobiia bacterium]
MRSRPEPGRSGLTWVWVGVAVMSVGAVAVLRLDEGVTRIVVGAALAICLLAVGAMVWMDRRENRSGDRSIRRG